MEKATWALTLEDGVELARAASARAYAIVLLDGDVMVRAPGKPWRGLRAMLGAGAGSDVEAALLEFWPDAPDDIRSLVRLAWGALSPFLRMFGK